MPDFLRLIRFQNLIIIALSQYLVRYCIIKPILYNSDIQLHLSDLNFFLLVLSTVLIAAAGYTINDYFDTKTDYVNRPEKVVIDRSISRRFAMALHFVFNIAGIALGFYVGTEVDLYQLGYIHIFCSGLLWFYSTDFKKQFLTGNILVSFLTALTLLIVPLYEIPVAKAEVRTYHEEFMKMVEDPAPIISEEQARKIETYRNYVQLTDANLNFAFKVVALFAFFAFLMSLLREIVKDMEDFNGDKFISCKTIPIVLGLKKAAYICIAIAACIIMFLIYFQLKLLKQNDWQSFFYILMAIQLPLVIIAVKLNRDETPKQFHATSTFIKIVMLTGVLYMAVIYYHLQLT